MKLILHIGTTKTGSSSIQAFLARNRDVLKEQGYYYPLALGDQNQTNTAIYSTTFNQTPDLHRGRKLLSEEDAVPYRLKVASDFNAEMESLDGVHTVLISNEHLHSRCTKDEHLVRLKQLLGSHFSEISVLCYLRPQAEQLVSLYSTSLKKGNTRTFEEFVRFHLNKSSKNPYFHFEIFLKLWLRHFSREEIDIRLFNDVKKLEHGVITDFIQTVGLDGRNVAWDYPERVNESVTRMGQQLLRARNEGGWPEMKSDRWKQIRVKKLIEKYFAGTAGASDVAQTREFAASFDEANEWVRTNWFSDRDSILETNWEKIEGPESEDRIPVSFAEELATAAVRPGKREVDSAEALRDIALEMENSDMATALKLMRIAFALKPTGKRMRQKITEYEKALSSEK